MQQLYHAQYLIPAPLNLGLNKMQSKCVDIQRFGVYSNFSSRCNKNLAESGWSALKIELLPRGSCFADLEEARLELAHYYNTQRLHSALSYCTPFEIEFRYCFILPWLSVHLNPATSIAQINPVIVLQSDVRMLEVESIKLTCNSTINVMLLVRISNGYNQAELLS